MLYLPSYELMSPFCYFILLSAILPIIILFNSIKCQISSKTKLREQKDFENISSTKICLISKSSSKISIEKAKPQLPNLSLPSPITMKSIITIIRLKISLSPTLAKSIRETYRILHILDFTLNQKSRLKSIWTRVNK
jgi:hypothetical protein